MRIRERLQLLLQGPRFPEYKWALIRRKTAHLMGAVLLVIAFFSGIESSLILIYLAALSYSVYELLKWRFNREFAPLSRAFKFAGSPEHEWDLPYVGPLYFGLGIILVALLFRYPIAFAAIAILTVGDSIAAIVGAVFGRATWQISDKKSVEGSLSGFASAFLAAMLFVSPIVAFVGAFIGMAMEALPVPVDDNLTIPISAAVAMTITSIFVTV